MLFRLAASVLCVAATLLPQGLPALGSCDTGDPRRGQLSVTSDRSAGALRLVLHSPDLEFGVADRYIDDVERVCHLPEDRLLVFGIAGQYPLYAFELIDLKQRLLVDSLLGFNPTLSPDGHWLMFRQFYPLSGTNASDGYRLYDLTKDAAWNRNGQPENTEYTGRLVYPLIVGEDPRFTGPDLPADEIHTFGSVGFYWSDDSSTVAFADGLQGEPSIVLVRIEDGQIRTYVYPIRSVEACPPPYARVTGVHFVPRSPANYDIIVDLEAAGVACRPLNLKSQDFTPAQPEKRSARHLKPSVRKDK